jgi:lysophospholipase L1-like esterase
MPAAAPRPLNRGAAIVALLVIQLIVGLVLVEAVVRVLYAHPAPWYPAGIRNFLKWEYFYRRDIIQLDERFARYDPELLYTLRPGRFTFANVEYSTPYVVNSLGVRDDEASLAQPDIVVVGDSYAMGWGVQQDEAFPQVIARRTGRRVLNTGVSSYGTVREMRLLDRVDLSRATTLIVQYCSNDYPENDEFEQHGNRHIPSSREAWLSARVQPRRVPKYWPLPMTYSLATWIKRGIEGRRPANELPSYVPETTARLFLNALIHAPTHDLSALRIIVTDPDPDPAFIRALDRLHTSPQYPPYIQRMTVVDVSAYLTPDQYYVLDDHFRASAHVAIADALVSVLKQK